MIRVGARADVSTNAHIQLKKLSCKLFTHIFHLQAQACLFVTNFFWLSTSRHAIPVFTSKAIKEFTDLPDAQDLAYGPQEVRQLCADLGTDSQGHLVPKKSAIKNADSYAWFANVSTTSFPTLS